MDKNLMSQLINKQGHWAHPEQLSHHVSICQLYVSIGILFHMLGTSSHTIVLSVNAAKILVNAFILLRLNYCKSLSFTASPMCTSMFSHKKHWCMPGHWLIKVWNIIQVLKDL